MPSATKEKLLSVEEFMDKYGHCSGVELIRGRVVWAGRELSLEAGGASVPKFPHGVYANQAAFLLTQFAKTNNLGWVASNDTFVPIDSAGSVLAPDVLFVSYAKIPKGKPPEDLVVAPELVLEVRSPTDRWGDMFGKVGDFLNAGVTVVIVLDPATRSASVYRQDGAQQILRGEDKLTLPDVLPGFEAPVARFFEE
jgi:Uma2 family endonuclease